MTKELEALDWLKNDCYVESPQNETFDECLEVIEKALLELKAIKEAKPSEALECLERLYNGFQNGMAGRSYYDTIKQALLKSEKLEKTLKVIIEKGVIVVKLRFCNNLTEYYGDGYEKFIVNPLTQQEFELLKEVLE